MSRFRTRLPLFLLVGATLASVPVVLGFFGTVHPAFDSFSHLRAHLAVAMAVLALPLLFTGLRREGAVALLFAVMAFGTTLGGVQDYLSGNSARADPVSGARYSLVQINLRFDNPEPKRILQMIAREKPDVITYEEAGEAWKPWLDILQGSYPYRLNCAWAEHTWGVGILSRRPFSENGRKDCVGDGLLAIASINFGGTDVNVAALHFSWPWPRRQPYQLRRVEPELQKLKGPLVIGGDLNAAPWSETVRRVEAASGARHMTGIGGTWLIRYLPASLAPYLGLPIDQVFVSKEIEAPKASARPDAGSDHLPVRLDFSVPMPVHPDEDEAPTQQVMAQ